MLDPVQHRDPGDESRYRRIERAKPSPASSRPISGMVLGCPVGNGHELTDQEDGSGCWWCTHCLDYVKPVRRLL